MDRTAQLAEQCRVLVALSRSLNAAEDDREQRLQERLAELDAWIEESVRLQKLITGGAARREARLRALEDAVDEIASRCASKGAPRALDVPRRTRFDASVVKMHSIEPSEPPASSS
jgi:hypothetical protein